MAEISFIFGLDFLNKNNFVINSKNNCLHSTSEDITLFHLWIGEIEAYQQIIAQVVTTILARRDAFRRNGEKTGHYWISQRVTVSLTLVDLSEETLPVRVIKVTDKDSLSKVRGYLLATCVERNSHFSWNGSSQSDALQSWTPSALWCLILVVSRYAFF